MAKECITGVNLLVAEDAPDLGAVTAQRPCRGSAARLLPTPAHGKPPRPRGASGFRLLPALPRAVIKTSRFGGSLCASSPW